MKKEVFKLMLKYELLIDEMENDPVLFSSVKHKAYKEFLSELKEIFYET